MITPERLKGAWRLANSYPIASERRYAARYIDWLNRGCVGAAPDRGKNVTVRRAHMIRREIDALNLWGTS